jgi:hypothetical protein
MVAANDGASLRRYHRSGPNGSAYIVLAEAGLRWLFEAEPTSGGGARS